MSNDEDAKPGELGPAFELLYQELRVLARRRMRGERPEHTLQPTALIHEVYLKVSRQVTFAWASKEHFVALAAQAMRQVLADYGRKRQAAARAGQRVELDLEAVRDTGQVSILQGIVLHDALKKLALQQPHGTRHARLVELVWLGGMGFTEAAAVLGISRRQAHRDWAWARTWLEKEIAGA